MQQMEVKPPAAAARAPVSIVSECSMPGSRRCTCMSMKPGATTSPAASKTGASECSRCCPSPAIRPFSIRTSAGPSWREAGSMMRPFLMSSDAIHMFSHDALEHGHANRHPVFHLIEDHGTLKVGNLGRQLAAAIDGPGVHDDGIRLGA